MNRLVVCVDDDPDMLASVARALRSLDIELVQFNDPREALVAVGTRDVAVLLSDFEMPQMTGVELTSAARRVRPETVRILMTGRQSLDTAVDGINVGEIFRYVQKPFEVRGLRTAIEEGIQRHHELVTSASEREQSIRREKLTGELEQEYPGITMIQVAYDGVYEVPPIDRMALQNLGLDSLLVASGN